MKKRKPITLIATAILAIVFMFVFVINMTSTVRKDSKSDNLSLSELTSYAQSNGGEMLGDVNINCSSGNEGQCYIMNVETGSEPSTSGMGISFNATCVWSGYTGDYCDSSQCLEVNEQGPSLEILEPFLDYIWELII